jgi:dihydropteroate synthase
LYRFPVPRRFTIPLAHGGRLAVGDRTLIMGVVNVTPDSFSDGGLLLDPARAIEAGIRIAEEGADLIDVGGESTRPGADPIEASVEQRRVIPVVEGLAERVSVPVSVDTYRASTAAAAVKAGAALVNDVSGLTYDPDLAGAVAASGAAIVIMHTRGRSRDMYRQASYHDVIAEVLDELRQTVAFAASAGIGTDRIIVDPGLGFAKEAAHTYEVLAGLSAFAELGRPLLVGPSRKSFLAKPLGAVVAPADRDWATAAAVTAAVLAGAHIVRVHAVREMLQVVRIADEIRRYHAET